MKRRKFVAISFVWIFILFAGLYSAILMYIHMGKDDTAIEEISYSYLESEYTNSLVGKNLFIDINGLFSKLLGMKGLYSSHGVYALNGEYLVNCSPCTSTDYEYEEIVSFKEWLKEKEINFIYVNYPTKYLDDDIMEDNFGVKSYSNRNADLLLKRIREADVNVIDLREELVRENMDIYSMFYKTDHHWTTSSGVWAAKNISKGLNTFCDYNIDLSTFDLSNFDIIEYETCWLGEQGRKIGATYVGLDDFTEIKPNYETHFSFDGWTGSFDDLVNDDIYVSDEDIYTVPSWHYSYIQTHVVNEDVGEGKVLVLGDSYNQVVIPFLALAVNEIDVKILRDGMFDGSIRDYIEEKGFDTVIVSYSLPTIGGHDNPYSVNYKLFTFE